MLTFLNIYHKLKSEHTFLCEWYRGGNRTMTDNEMKLIKMIRENDKPGTALMTAAVIILGFLKQRQSSEAQAVAALQEHA